jgi:hypothetical protein
MADRSGIEIDYCPTCRGVWLDRGELDKIIERSAVTTSPRQSVPARDDDRRDDDRRYEERRYDDRRYHGSDSYGYKKKKKNPLSELFDF